MGCAASTPEADKNNAGATASNGDDNAPAPGQLDGGEGAPRNVVKVQAAPTVKMSKAQELALKKRQEEEEAEKKKKNARARTKKDAPPPEIRTTRAADLAAAKQRSDNVSSPAANKGGKTMASKVSPSPKAASSEATNPLLTPSMSESMPTAMAASSSTAMSPAPDPTFTEDDFRGFTRMKMLGKGSFGTTYECGLRSCKIVCVKVIEFGLGASLEDLAQLRSEIALMKRFNHPNIVQYYGCTEDETSKNINIFMEYVTGGTLTSYLKRFDHSDNRGRLPTETAKDWTRQMLLGVQYLHDSGVIHRDIKGANILVTNHGVLKLADFGCSKSIDEACSRTRGCSTMVGTPYWMAPEVLKSEPYGTKADIWSVGCTVVEMVTGKPPWPEMDNMWAAVYKIANSKGLPPGIPKDLSKDMIAFLEKCFERDPKKRPTAAELLKHKWLASG
uniref:Protein kinase domain-containing protein n=1 Tax=Neobodo designis TaxID=312471 RepID=A0A6U4W5G9_NEODS|mmetsp:Transcript_48407/g.149432  ORF Transcript_48407/g.149432 Transcript_48407/m.149432 type:complete len:446 (+) Transcript_48407:89-1426(+)